MHSLDDLKAGRLAGTARLDLACGLERFPAEIFDLADSLEVLNLTGNQLTSLPDDLGRLYKLKVLFCSENRLSELPVGVGRYPSGPCRRSRGGRGDQAVQGRDHQ